jgi:predicted amidophosphoribosyltransferase
MSTEQNWCPYCQSRIEFDGDADTVTCQKCGKMSIVDWDRFPDGEGGSVFCARLLEQPEDGAST